MHLPVWRGSYKRLQAEHSSKWQLYLHSSSTCTDSCFCLDCALGWWQSLVPLEGTFHLLGYLGSVAEFSACGDGRACRLLLLTNIRRCPPPSRRQAPLSVSGISRLSRLRVRRRRRLAFIAEARGWQARPRELGAGDNEWARWVLDDGALRPAKIAVQARLRGRLGTQAHGSRSLCGAL